MRCIRAHKQPNIGYHIAKYFDSLYPFSTNLKDEFALYAFSCGKLDVAYDVIDSSLKKNVLTEEVSSRLLFKSTFFD